MKTIQKYAVVIIMMICSISSSQAMTVWAVETGANPFSSSQGALTLSEGVTTLDIYYDVAGDTSYGYDFLLDVSGTGSITSVGGGDSELGDVFGSGWRQFGGSVYGETGSSVLAFTLDFTALAGASLSVSGSYTDSNFSDTPVAASTLATVSAGEPSTVPVPAAVWLFGSGLIGMAGMARRKKA